MTASRPARLNQLLIASMAKHLPPSAQELRLVDINGFCGDTLLKDRPDLRITPAETEELSALAAESFDAVVSFDVALAEPFLGDALRLLRPGGRLITVDSAIDPDTQAVSTLEASGFVRILVETGAECPLPVGRLARGEKSHVIDDTLARVRVALADTRLAPADLAAFRGRYVHLLIRQTPNLPVWKLEQGQRIEWNAVALRHDDQPVLLAFSSLPAAVAFMQQAVLKGTIRDVNKVAKFQRPSAQAWNRPVLLDARADQFQSDQLLWLPVDPAEAELPDE